MWKPLFHDYAWWHASWLEIHLHISRWMVNIPNPLSNGYELWTNTARMKTVNAHISLFLWMDNWTPKSRALLSSSKGKAKVEGRNPVITSLAQTLIRNPKNRKQTPNQLTLTLRPFREWFRWFGPMVAAQRFLFKLDLNECWYPTWLIGPPWAF